MDPSHIGTDLDPQIKGSDLQEGSFCLLLFEGTIKGPKEVTKPVLRIRIHRIHMFLGLLYPDLDPLGRGMDPDPVPDPSINKQK